MIVLLMTLTINASDSQDVKRIHYGVIFKDEGQVSFSPDFWAHTIKIALPTLSQWNKIHYCKYVDDLNCSPDEHLAREINLLREVVLEELHMTMLTIFELVPELDDDREKRAPVLDFVSTIGKTVFGFAKQGGCAISSSSY